MKLPFKNSSTSAKQIITVRSIRASNEVGPFVLVLIALTGLFCYSGSLTVIDLPQAGLSALKLVGGLMIIKLMISEKRNDRHRSDGKIIVWLAAVMLALTVGGMWLVVSDLVNDSTRHGASLVSGIAVYIAMYITMRPFYKDITTLTVETPPSESAPATADTEQVTT